MLADRTIKTLLAKKEIVITGLTTEPDLFGDSLRVQPVSVDLSLGALADEEGFLLFDDDQVDYYHIGPGEFILGSTAERVEISNNIVGLVHGKSTRARQGLQVHAAGLVDPGFKGQLTLEIFNMSSKTIQLVKGMLICQISFDFLSSTPDRAYGHPALGSHYQGQTGPTAAVILP